MHIYPWQLISRNLITLLFLSKGYTSMCYFCGPDEIKKVVVVVYFHRKRGNLFLITIGY